MISNSENNSSYSTVSLLLLLFLKQHWELKSMRIWGHSKNLKEREQLKLLVYCGGGGKYIRFQSFSSVRFCRGRSQEKRYYSEWNFSLSPFFVPLCCSTDFHSKLYSHSSSVQMSCVRPKDFSLFPFSTLHSSTKYFFSFAGSDRGIAILCKVIVQSRY